MTTTSTIAESAEAWRAKGDFWMALAANGVAPQGILVPLQFAVADDTWSTVIVLAGIVCLTGQIGAFMRQVQCYRRASKIRKGAVAS